MKIELLKLKNLSLKKIKKNEIEIIRKERNKFSIRKNMLIQKKISKQEQLKWFEDVRNSSSNEFFNIYYKELLIGSGSFKDIDRQNKKCSWGFYIFEKYFGIFGIIAQYKIIDYAFKYFRIHKLYGRTISTNLKILKIHKKFGFKIEGVLRNHLIINKKKLNIVLTALFKNDWLKIKKKLNKYFY